jgi:hypothetical protein
MDTAPYVCVWWWLYLVVHVFPSEVDFEFLVNIRKRQTTKYFLEKGRTSQKISQ